jgi:hypothetical protein
MQIKIFTIPFSEETEGFDTTDIEEFCFNKKVYKLLEKIRLQNTNTA